MRLKIAAFAPIPSASVSTATAVKPGFLNNWRQAKRRSFIETIGEGRGARGEGMKHQIPNTKLQIPIGAVIPQNWSKRFGTSLVFGAWCLEFSFGFLSSFGIRHSSFMQARNRGGFPRLQEQLTRWLRPAHWI